MEFEYEKGFRIETLDNRFNPKGDIVKVWHEDSQLSLHPPREIYTSSIYSGQFKGWKLHKKMTMRLHVVIGSIRFYFISESDRLDIKCCKKNPILITVPPQIWFGFENEGSDTGIILNIPNLRHDPDESISVSTKEEIYF